MNIRAALIGYDDLELNVADRQVVRAMYRSLSETQGKEVARWEATRLAVQLDAMRLRLDDRHRWMLERSAWLAAVEQARPGVAR